MSKALTEESFVRAAKRLNVSVPAIKAVCKVESPRGGFNPDGSPVTLFEGHWFHKMTNGIYSTSHTDISYPRWTREHYGRDWKQEKFRLERAVALNRDAALQCASWGRFQIMGFNYRQCGFETVQGFINAMFKSEEEQLMAFTAYIDFNDLDDELRNKQWASFARQYNGPRFKENRYDTKLAAAYIQSGGRA